MATPPTFSAGAVLTAAQMNKVGLWKVVPTASVTGAGASVSVSTNGDVSISGNATALTLTCFTSEFDAYKIVWTGGNLSGNAAITGAMGGSTAGSAFHNYVLLFANWNGGAASSINNALATNWPYVGGGNASGAVVNIELTNPYLSKNTYITNGVYASDVNAGTLSGYYAGTTSFTQITFGTSSGTMTGGKWRVYGYNALA